MKVVGIDLSGPTNVADTAMVVFSQDDTRLVRDGAFHGVGDIELLERLRELVGTGERVVVGLDAPLSYNPGGGDRPQDADLRTKAVEAGLHPGTVMTPTQTRMAYLTLRGVAITRAIAAMTLSELRVVEVHPKVSLALRGAPLEQVLALSDSQDARLTLLDWLEGQGVRGISVDDPTSHYVSACAAALAAWKWDADDAVWVSKASPPLHPYDFVC